jgi:hypothetical protein
MRVLPLATLAALATFATPATPRGSNRAAPKFGGQAQLGAAAFTAADRGKPATVGCQRLFDAVIRFAGMIGCNTERRDAPFHSRHKLLSLTRNRDDRGDGQCVGGVSVLWRLQLRRLRF